MVKVVGELKNVLLTLSVDPRIHQTVDIVVTNIDETYGMWMSRDWSKKLKGYFATDWSHLWLPYNGRSNQIKIVMEPFIKQIVIDLNDLSELVVFFTSAIEHYTFDSFFGSFPVDSSTTKDVDKFSKINNCTIVPFTSDIVHNVYNVNTNLG